MYMLIYICIYEFLRDLPYAHLPVLTCNNLIRHTQSLNLKS